MSVHYLPLELSDVVIPRSAGDYGPTGSPVMSTFHFGQWFGGVTGHVVPRSWQVELGAGASCGYT